MHDANVGGRDPELEWAALVEQALQGLHHALNNRIGSLSAIVELFQLGDLPPDGGAPGFESLAADLARLEDCSRMVRLLPRDDVPGEEALILDDVIADVLAIHRFLHDVRDLPVTIVPTRYVEPVRVERWALVRALTLLLLEAKLAAQRAGAALRAITESDEQWVTVEYRLSPGSDAPPESRGAYADQLAASFGGIVVRKPGTFGLRLPTLKARRAADRQ